MLHQLGDGNVRVVDQGDHALADFAQVVRRNAGGHAHGDAVAAVDQQVGELRRQDGRFGVTFVVGRNKVDRVELEVFEHQRGGGRHACFGVSHGSGWQAGDRAEVALLVDQHVAHVPLLGHPHQGWVDHRFTVRMVVTAGIT